MRWGITNLCCFFFSVEWSSQFLLICRPTPRPSPRALISTLGLETNGIGQNCSRKALDLPASWLVYTKYITLIPFQSLSSLGGFASILSFLPMNKNALHIIYILDLTGSAHPPFPVACPRQPGPLYWNLIYHRVHLAMAGHLIYLILGEQVPLFSSRFTS